MNAPVTRSERIVAQAFPDLFSRGLIGVREPPAQSLNVYHAKPEIIRPKGKQVDPALLKARAALTDSEHNEILRMFARLTR